MQRTHAGGVPHVASLATAMLGRDRRRSIGRRPAVRSAGVGRRGSELIHVMPAAISSRDGLTAWLLVAPAALCLLVLFVLPVGYVLVLSVTDPEPSLEHYHRLLTVPLYGNVLLNTFRTSLIVTIACLALGYPLAYVMSRRNDLIAIALLVAVGLSF